MKIFFPKNNRSIFVKEGDTVLDAVRKAGLEIEANCSGLGTCGKCLVDVEGVTKLACRTLVKDGMNVEILSHAEGQEIETRYSKSLHQSPASGRISLAVDLGTTTVVVKALDTGSGSERSIRAFTNPQRVYGADVLSRINHSMDDAASLSKLIRNTIDEKICEILDDIVGETQGIEKIVIAGNTTMMYLLLNLRCRSLGLAPFEPEYEIVQTYSYSAIFGKDTLSCPVMIYPFISAFVGGDIVSGLVNIEKHFEVEKEPSYMLVDMGTNGEIAYHCGSRLITTSTAAGPALEGGNISCGMSGLPGAIYETNYKEKGRFSNKTIGGKAAIGICGSGVISLVATLLEASLITETGAFSEEVSDTQQIQIDDNIIITQKDIREFQLAKGAIRAGIDILISEMGEVPGMLYLAGGFGQNINLESAFRVGLIPEELRGRIRFAGNTSLGGCVDACMDEGADTSPRVLEITKSSVEINLGSHKSFNDIFMEAMMFEERS